MADELAIVQECGKVTEDIMSNPKQDAINKTKEHIDRVGQLMGTIAEVIKDRAGKHDASKLEEPEVGYFIKYTPKLAGLTYGSKEYKDVMKELKPALDHHYEENRHHPEHFENGIKDMCLVDLIEMICDWMASSERHEDGDIEKSIEINQERFGYSDELKQILLNTVKSIRKKQQDDFDDAEHDHMGA